MSPSTGAGRGEGADAPATAAPPTRTAGAPPPGGVDSVRHPARPAHLDALLDEYGLVADAIVLGHRANTAAQSVGAGMAQGQSNVTGLGGACIRLADERTDPRKRQREFNRVQRLLLKVLKIDAVGHSTERAAELAGVNLEWLRRSAVHLALAVGSHDTDLAVSDWVAAARTSIASIAATARRPCAAVGTLFPTPQNSVGKTMRELLKTQAGVVGLRH